MVEVGAGVVVPAEDVDVPVALPPLVPLLELPLPTLVVPVLVVGVVVVTAGIVATTVDVVATCCGVKGLRPLPVRFELPGDVCTEIAGSVVPDE